jgi:alkylation response protein AidB-like acyl-CoA dehydrogenase
VQPVPTLRRVDREAYGQGIDLTFTAEDEAFREEVRGFVREALPAEVRRKMEEGRALSRDEVVDWQRRLNARGWATPSWPKDHGGPGWTPVQRHIFLDELHQAPAPEPLSFNVSMIGPVLIAYGDPAQKDRFLARAANADDWWAQGSSEPGAGSDLANIKTVAVRDGDAYVVTGQKMWQGMAHRADWMFTLVRTDPTAPKKQAGYVGHAHVEQDHREVFLEHALERLVAGLRLHEPFTERLEDGFERQQVGGLVVDE